MSAATMEYWEQTQRVLQGEVPIVRRPKLTEMLLKKPPFRFLHDVISEVCNQTGFAKGLYNAQEQISTNITDKESKMAYLWKIINCVGITLQATVPVRPSKIVAGLEPEQTSAFLQMLAAATRADKKTSEKAVLQVLAGEKQPPAGQGGTQWIQLLKELMALKPVSSEASAKSPEQRSSSAARPRTPAKADKDRSVITDETPRTLEQASRVTSAPSLASEASDVSKNQVNESGIAVSRSYSGAARSSSPSQSANKPSRSHDTVEQKTDASSNSKTFSKHHSSRKDSSSHSHQSQQGSSGSSAHRSSTSSKENSPTKLQSSRAALPHQSLQDDARTVEEATRTLELQSPMPSPKRVFHQFDEARPISEPHSAGADICRSLSMHSKEEDIGGNILSSNVATGSIIHPNSAREEGAGERIKTPPRPGTPMKQNSLACPEQRPQSARKAPPKSKIEKGEIADRPSSRAFTRELHKKPSFFLDDEEHDDDFDEPSFCLPSANAVTSQEIVPTSHVAGIGKAVENSLSCKEDLNKMDGKKKNHDSPSSDTQGQTGIVLLGGRLNKISTTKDEHLKTATKDQEIQSLRDALQTLCRTINPLGKSMDLLQEDAATMSKEYKFWVKEHERYREKLEQEKRITADMLEEESGKTSDLDEKIRQQNQLINTLKSQMDHITSRLHGARSRYQMEGESFVLLSSKLNSKPEVVSGGHDTTVLISS